MGSRLLDKRGIPNLLGSPIDDGSLTNQRAGVASICDRINLVENNSNQCN